MSHRIPFNRPSRGAREAAYAAEAVASDSWSGDGRFTERCAAILEAELGTARCLLTPSGTAALELAALVLDIGPGDEVVVPSFTFTSTVNAFVLRGAVPVFVDVDPRTLALDPALVAERVNERTKAIVVVHYAGIAADLGGLLDVAGRSAAALVEDNAHGLFGRWQGRSLGTVGTMGALSFHETKNLSCGEGGALLVNDPALVPKAEVMREKGTDRSRMRRGEVDRYTWRELGSSHLLGEIPAAVLLAQLERAPEIQAKRRAIWERYRDELASWATASRVRLPEVPAGVEPAWHLFHLVLPTTAARDGLIDHLGAEGILAVFHYLPLHESEVAARYGTPVDLCPVTTSVSARLLRLPLYTDLTPAEQAQVIESVRRFSC